MKFLLRRWRGILAITIIAFLAAEVLILLSNNNPANLRAVRIHHDESPYGPWLVMRVENTHLFPIRLMGLGGDRELPWAAYQIERDRQDGSKDSWANGWCTSTYCIVVPPFSSREIAVPLPEPPKDARGNDTWEILLWGEDTSLFSGISPFGEDEMVVGHYSPRDQLPVTGDPSAKEAAERKARNSCCGEPKEEQPAGSNENVIP